VQKFRYENAFYGKFEKMIKEKCNRCGTPLGKESKKTKQKFCRNCKQKFDLYK
jgi:uncharacterized Zn finger protein (UPF0148 family)